jgi:hypothetical protein
MAGMVPGSLALLLYSLLSRLSSGAHPECEAEARNEQFVQSCCIRVLHSKAHCVLQLQCCGVEANNKMGQSLYQACNTAL